MKRSIPDGDAPPRFQRCRAERAHNLHPARISCSRDRCATRPRRCSGALAAVLFEFWAVVTRPIDANGLGWSPAQAAGEVDELIQRFTVLREPDNILSEWLILARRYGVSGKRVLDLRLVAAANALVIQKIVTFSIDHFRSFGEIEAIHPADIR